MLDPIWLFAAPGRGVDAAVDAYVDYIAEKLSQGVPLNAMTRHMLGVYHGRPGARAFRRHLSENATSYGAGIDVLKDALALVQAHAAQAPCEAPDNRL